MRCKAIVELDYYIPLDPPSEVFLHETLCPVAEVKDKQRICVHVEYAYDGFCRCPAVVIAEKEEKEQDEG